MLFPASPPLCPSSRAVAGIVVEVTVVVVPAAVVTVATAVAGIDCDVVNVPYLIRSSSGMLLK